MISDKKKCCEMMEYNSNFICEQHLNKYECPDTLIDYNEKSGSYSIIIHDGGESGIEIKYCPWCSQELNQKKCP